MPAETACPIPGVDQALSSYINSRDDTLKIRRTISRYLTASLRPVKHATQNQHVNHACPQSISATNTNPPGLKDSRIAFLRVLRANSQAEARHRELQASLEDLQTRHVDENPTLPLTRHNNESTYDYINLLRQRRKLAELNIVQESLEKLLNAKPFIHSHDPRDHVQEAIGEQPDLPAERLVQIAQPQDDQSSTFKLKQEVLEARARMDRAEITRKQAHSVDRDQSGLHRQVHALERAREEIIEWIQGELAKMEEDSVFLEDASPIKSSAQEHTSLDLSSAEARIRASYDQYTLARVQLIESYYSLNEPQPENGKIKSDDMTKELPKVYKGTELVTPITKLLPHLPFLARFAQNERSLLQQAVFLQSQLAVSDQELSEALLRLSGESHLLPAGAKDASAWGKVATEAEIATDKSVKEYLQTGRQEIGSISTIVDLCSLQSKVLAAV
ncbi:uncharacterized protein EKO05_0002215 [Ascochyta rabiei]|uniref:Uncharacterized protein n=1 Tax=Didymella rabiei TaxID=5454 RepID=A0A163JCZ2_DIDRA|nr:uncharacterized protein EKO05_0002215 [Ascochyta rabiei]KZM26283.1 hypothetical protein ST47_g2577 [Ascochyta rabiei]UPX11619.1 hypothetical protein EKO05_0002215 [Ascochyta rabiei]